MIEARFQFALKDAKALDKEGERIEKLCREYTSSSVPPGK